VEKKGDLPSNPILDEWKILRMNEGEMLFFEPDFPKSFVQIGSRRAVRICFRMEAIYATRQAGQTHFTSGVKEEGD
jgi:hypothetical protein